MIYAEQTGRDYARLMAAPPVPPADAPKKPAKKAGKSGAKANGQKERKAATA